MINVCQFLTADGLKLTGLLWDVADPVAVVVHVHGNSGNFYENAFLHAMARTYCDRRVALFAFNNRGHDVIAEAYHHNSIGYIGAAFEDISLADLDIDAALSVCKQMAPRMLIQGHSFGCLKVLAYALHARLAPDFVLLSPADTLRLHALYIAPETISEQLARIRAVVDEHPFQLLPPSEFGIRHRGKEYSIPISRRALVSLLESKRVKLLSFENAIDYWIDARAFVYIGGADALQTTPPAIVEEFLRARISDVELHHHAGGDHHFTGLEVELAMAVADWIHSR